MLNTHHLELFYYVAKHEGIVNACRHIPYGVQQPAVSAQMIRLEEDLGVTLFRRRPFQLTPAGRELFDFVAPFFGNLGEIEARLRGETIAKLRIAGLSEVMRDHAPGLLAALKRRHPGLRLTVVEADQELARQIVLRGEADLAVTVLDSSLPPGMKSRALLRLPLALLVPEDSPYHSAADAIRAGAGGRLDLVSLPPHELLPRLFATRLQKQGREWPIAIQVSSAEMIAPYVARGLGAGLTVSTSLLRIPQGVRELPLKGFPNLVIGAFWADRLGPVAQEFLDGISTAAAGKAGSAA